MQYNIFFDDGLGKSHYMYSSGPSFEFETENPDNNDDVRAKNCFKSTIL